MPFLIMSRIKFVGQSALIIAIKAENGPPDMQLLKTTTTNNQGMVSGEVGWGAVTSFIEKFDHCQAEELTLKSSTALFNV